FQAQTEVIASEQKVAYPGLQRFPANLGICHPFLMLLHCSLFGGGSSGDGITRRQAIDELFRSPIYCFLRTKVVQLRVARRRRDPGSRARALAIEALDILRQVI